jgi:hypothetical protein
MLSGSEVLVLCGCVKFDETVLFIQMCCYDFKEKVHVMKVTRNIKNHN